MLKWIYRLLFEPIYIDPTCRRDEPPDYLTLRELADLPAYHACKETRCQR